MYDSEQADAEYDGQADEQVNRSADASDGAQSEVAAEPLDASGADLGAGEFADAIDGSDRLATAVSTGADRGVPSMASARSAADWAWSATTTGRPT